MTIVKSIFKNNEATDSSRGGGGIYVEGAATVTVQDCSMFGNSAHATPGGDEVYILVDGGNTPSVLLINIDFGDSV